MELINITFLLSETFQLLRQISIQSVLNKTLLHKVPLIQPKLHFDYTLTTVKLQPNPHNTRLDHIEHKDKILNLLQKHSITEDSDFFPVPSLKNTLSVKTSGH